MDVGNLRLHVAEAGRGEPIVLLHGWPQHWYLWRHVMPALAPDARLLALDLRGAGWSDAPEGGYDKETLAEDVIGALDALGLERVRLAGHDWGGWVAQLVAMRVPARVERLQLFNIPHLFQRARPGDVRHLWRFWYMAVNASPALGERLHRDGRWLRAALRQGVTDKSVWSEHALDEFVDAYREPARARAGMRLYRDFLLREQPALARGRHAGGRFEMPVRLVFGVDDAAIPLRLLEGLEDHGDDVRVELVPDCGHFIVDERPGLVIDRMRSFLTSS